MGKKVELKKPNEEKPEFSGEGENIIISPHPDDELIGCYSLLKDENIKPIIIYTGELTETRKKETLNLKTYFRVKAQLFLNTVPQQLMTKENKFYFPSPDEFHPDHRMQANVGEAMARSGADVTFYTIQMNVPYIYELKDWQKKKEILDKVYPSQKDLWVIDLKYVLFEGFMKWIFPTQIKK